MLFNKQREQCLLERTDQKRSTVSWTNQIHSWLISLLLYHLKKYVLLALWTQEFYTHLSGPQKDGHIGVVRRRHRETV